MLSPWKSTPLEVLPWARARNAGARAVLRGPKERGGVGSTSGRPRLERRVLRGCGEGPEDRGPSR